MKIMRNCPYFLTSESLKKTNVSAQFTKSNPDKLCSSWKLKCRQVATLWTSDLTQLEFSLADLTQLEFSLADLTQLEFSLADLTWLEFSLADLTWLEFSLAKACQIGLC